MSVERNELIAYCNNVLKAYEYSDYGPNGLQVEGKSSIQKISFAVSATLDSITNAVSNGSDCLIVHHGILWNYHGARPLTGPVLNRISPLIKNDINLIGYHLPLDGHPEIGNAASIARRLNMENIEPFGEYKGSYIGVKATFKHPIKVKDLRKEVENSVNHQVILASPNVEEEISSMGIITGGATSSWSEAVTEELSAYLTGEISEHSWNDSQEAGIHMLAAGHYATEIFGIKNLMQLISDQFDIECNFIDSNNPV